MRWRQERDAGIGRLGKFRDSKVEHFHAIAAQAVWFQPNVIRLQIAMKDALLMSFVNGGANLFENVRDPVKRQTILFSEHVAERAAIQIFHDEVCNPVRASAGKTKVGNVDYVGMTQAAGGACFALEALDKFLVAHELRRNQFQGYVSFRAQVRGQINRAHAALTEQSLKAILIVENLSDVLFEIAHPK